LVAVWDYPPDEATLVLDGVPIAGEEVAMFAWAFDLPTLTPGAEHTYELQSSSDPYGEELPSSMGSFHVAGQGAFPAPEPIVIDSVERLGGGTGWEGAHVTPEDCGATIGTPSPCRTQQPCLDQPPYLDLAVHVAPDPGVFFRGVRRVTSDLSYLYPSECELPMAYRAFDVCESEICVVVSSYDWSGALAYEEEVCSPAPEEPPSTDSSDTGSTGTDSSSDTPEPETGSSDATGAGQHTADSSCACQSPAVPANAATLPLLLLLGLQRRARAARS
jgi:hypothetical protein